MLKTLPCFFPTTVYLVDDNLNFLQSLQSILPRHTAFYQNIQNPAEALDQLMENQNDFKTYLKAISFNDKEANTNQKLVKVDIEAFRTLMETPGRFNIPSVLIIDEEMPQMKGQDVCKALQSHPIKKLMLTGEADDQLAIALLNEGIIDQFLNKSDPQFFEKLPHMLASMQLQYFESHLETLWSILTSPLGDKPINALSDPKFHEFFTKLCEKHQIREYYLADDYGSFMLVDNNGKLSIFAVKESRDMTTVENIASGARSGVSPYTLKQLKARTHMLYIHKREHRWYFPNAWEEYGWIYPAKFFKGYRGAVFYYALLDSLNN